jgi:hypothetical protein
MQDLKWVNRMTTTFLLVLWIVRKASMQSPTLGAHTHAHAHAHGFWVGMGSILLSMGGHG